MTDDTAVPVYRNEAPQIDTALVNDIVTESSDVVYLLDGAFYGPYWDGIEEYNDLTAAGETRDVSVTNVFAAGGGLSYALDMDVYWYEDETVPEAGVMDHGVPFCITGASPGDTDAAQELINAAFDPVETQEERIRASIDSVLRRETEIPVGLLQKLLFYTDVKHAEEYGNTLTGTTWEHNISLVFSPHLLEVLQRNYPSRRKTDFDTKVYSEHESPVYNWHTDRFASNIYDNIGAWTELDDLIQETAAYQEANDSTTTGAEINIEQYHTPAI